MRVVGGRTGQADTIAGQFRKKIADNADMTFDSSYQIDTNF
nr:hypothetical protein [uncultured Albidiferax sp.]